MSGKEIKKFDLSFEDTDQLDRQKLVISRHGKQIAEIYEPDPECPEDHSFGRDIGEFVNWIERAYKFGLEDGQSELQTTTTDKIQPTEAEVRELEILVEESTSGYVLVRNDLILRLVRAEKTNTCTREA